MLPIFISHRDAEIVQTLQHLCEVVDIPLATEPPDEAHIWLQEQQDACQLTIEPDGDVLARFTLPLRVRELVQAIYEIDQSGWDPSLAVTAPALAQQPRDWYLDIRQRAIIQRKDEALLLELTEKETDLMALLLNAGGGAISREALLEQIWGYHPHVETRTFETHLYRLRQKLATLPEAWGIRIQIAGGHCVLEWTT